MAKKIYYEKVGRRYKPVFEYDSDFLDSFPKGTHLVMSYPGGSSRRYNIDPALAPMIAAGRYAEDAMCAAMIKADEVKPQREPLTTAEHEAWMNLIKVWGEEARSLRRSCTRDVVEAGVKAMQDEANKMLEHPSVRDAYNQFMMVYQLVKEDNNG